MTFQLDKNILYPKDKRINLQTYDKFNDYYKVKYKLCEQFQPDVIAEIGVRAGYSAWTFLQARPEAQYTGFDANNGTHGGQGGEQGQYKQWAESILKDYNATLVDIDTQKTDTLNIKDVDMFHVDGDHTVEGVMHDLDIVFPCVKVGGVIIVDDIKNIPDVKKGCELWIEKMAGKVDTKYVESLRGELIITKTAE